MKNITIAFLILATITSCNDDILEYSCNPTVNKFVKTNILILSQIKLDEFNQMSNLLQRATFRSYSPEKRFELWTEKIIHREMLKVNKIEVIKRRKGWKPYVTTDKFEINHLFDAIANVDPTKGILKTPYSRPDIPTPAVATPIIS